MVGYGQHRSAFTSDWRIEREITDSRPLTMPTSNAAHALLIFGLAFVIEDVAVLGAALLVANGMVSLPWAAGSAFAGLWLDDVGTYTIAYALGRPVLERHWFRRLIGNVDLHKSEAWFKTHGTLAISLSRAVPGARVPMSLVAGFLRVPVWRFLIITALASAAWVAGLFFLSYHVGMMAITAFNMFHTELTKLLACGVAAVFLGWILRIILRKCSTDWLAKSKGI